VIKTDSEGVQQWVRFHGDYAYSSGAPALITGSGDILMAGAWQNTPPSPGSSQDQWASLYGYNSNGEMPWRKDYLWSYMANNTFILPKNTDHYWLIGGAYQYNVDPDHVMILMELDGNFDSLWLRRYWYYEPDDAESGVYCVRRTADNGLILCGGTRQGITDPLPYLTSNWLIKLDQDGCLIPGCHTVGIEEHALGLTEYLRVLPNPVAQGDQLRLSFQPPQDLTMTGQLRVVVLDALGRQVHEKFFGSHISTVDLHASFQPGLYHVHLTNGSHWLAGAKVVVE
jgi:hypothetical protein